MNREDISKQEKVFIGVFKTYKQNLKKTMSLFRAGKKFKIKKWDCCQFYDSI